MTSLHVTDRHTRARVAAYIYKEGELRDQTVFCHQRTNMCETSLEESMFDKADACDLLDSTMEVVADFASLLANGINQFCYFHFLYSAALNTC